MTKQKTRKELEEERLSWKFWALAWGIIFIITFIGLFVIGINGKRLETQLSECQDNVPAWTLKIECFNLRGRWIDQENYTEISNCLHFRDVAESWGCKIIENCEVLE